MLSRLADKLVLCPTRHPIAAPGKSRRLVDVDGERVEVWTHPNGDHSTDEAELFLLKFPGTGGRAERATDHPADQWPGVKAELWAVNPPGYGCSSGRASLPKLPRTADVVCEELQRVADGRPILVTGNSLGTATALYASAHHEVAGVILRNVLPLKELIVGHHGRWSLWVGAWLLARSVPRELDVLISAARCTAPAVFIVSRRDRTVPPKYQQPVIDAYAGPKQIQLLAEADHADLPTTVEQHQYAKLLVWLRERVLPARNPA